MTVENNTVTAGQNHRKDRVTRDSGIELLKILAIFLIVVSHVIQTLYLPNTYISYQDYVIDLSHATRNWQQLAVTMLRVGRLGNLLFIVSSSWFMLDSTRSNKRKVLQIIADIWIISVSIFVIIFILRDGQMGEIMILKQFFPTSFGNNWYMTCYLIFCFVYPFFNIILSHLNQKTLLRICFFLFALYFGINFFMGQLFADGELFFYSHIILWVTIYFIIAYVKYYIPNSMYSPRVNLFLLVIGIGGHCTIILITNFLGLEIEFFENKLMVWHANSSPFLLAIAIALFNFARNMRFRNRTINHISGLSYLIYIFHENILLRTYYRPMLWNYIHEAYGYDHLLLWTLVLSIIVFVFGLFCAYFYEQTVQRVVWRICDYGYPYIVRTWNKIENMILK